MREATVWLAVGDPGLQDEVLDFLDRRPGVRVVGAAVEGLGRAAHERRLDALVVGSDLVERVSSGDARLLVVERRETTESLRAAIRAGAHGFFLWPEDREALGAAADAARREGQPSDTPSGMTIAVFPGRGGAGATFLATNLAAALAARGTGTILVDLDAVHADVASVMGGADAAGALEQIAPLVDELTPEHVERVAAAHPAGFRILGPGDQPSTLEPRVASAVIGAMRRSFAATVVHLPRSVDPAVRASLLESDVVLVVISLDVPAVRGARRLLDHLDDGTLRARCRLVVNRATRGEILPADASEALGVPLAAVVPFDRSVPRAQNRGELVVGRSGPAARRVQRLARSVMDEVAA